MNECVFYCDGVFGAGGIVMIIILALACVGSMARGVSNGDSFLESVMFTVVVVMGLMGIMLLFVMTLVLVPTVLIVVATIALLMIVGWAIGKKRQ